MASMATGTSGPSINKRMKIKPSSIFVMPDKKGKKGAVGGGSNGGSGTNIGGSHAVTSLSLTAPVIKYLIDFLQRNGRETEGIFRVNGSLTGLQNLKAELLSHPFSSGDPNLDELDSHLAAGLIKLLLRELDEPLLLFSSYDHLLGALDVKDEKARLQVIKAIIDTLPKDNRQILIKMIDLFSVLAQNETLTKMNAHNLAVVMGPTIMRPAGENFETMMSDSGKVVAVVTTLINNSSIFKGSEAITITAPVKLNELEMDKLVHPSKPEKKEKRDLKKKYEDLKVKHRDLKFVYDELRTQHSVLEAYTTKVDQKVKELEELLDTIETNYNYSPRESTNECLNNAELEMLTEVQRLRGENETLRELMIKTTREEFSNIKEDSLRIRSPREIPSVRSLMDPPPKAEVEKEKEKESEKGKSLSSSSSSASLAGLNKQPSFIKKQNSTKIISKLASKASKFSEEAPPSTSAATSGVTRKLSTSGDMMKENQPQQQQGNNKNLLQQQLEAKKVFFDASQNDTKRVSLNNSTENTNPNGNVALNSPTGSDGSSDRSGLPRGRRTISSGTSKTETDPYGSCSSRPSVRPPLSWASPGKISSKTMPGPPSGGDLPSVGSSSNISDTPPDDDLRREIKEMKQVLASLTNTVNVLTGRWN